MFALEGMLPNWGRELLAAFNRGELFRTLGNRIMEAIMAIPGMVDAMAMARAIAEKINAALASIAGSLLSFAPQGMPGIPGFAPRGRGDGQTPGGLATPQSWVPPPPQARLMQIRNTLTIDGHRIGEAVSHYIAAAATHAQSAAQYDGGMSHVPVDMQFA